MIRHHAAIYQSNILVDIKRHVNTGADEHKSLCLIANIPTIKTWMQLHFFSYQQNPLMDVSLSCFFYPVLSVSLNPPPLLYLGGWQVEAVLPTNKKWNLSLAIYLKEKPVRKQWGTWLVMNPFNIFTKSTCLSLFILSISLRLLSCNQTNKLLGLPKEQYISTP